MSHLIHRTTQTCRVCKKTTLGGSMIKFGVRHYCCLACGVSRYGVESFLNKLTPWTVSQLIESEKRAELVAAGALEYAEKIVAKYREQQQKVSAR